MFSGPAVHLSGITFSFRKGHWSSVVLQLYDYYCKILLADVYSPMEKDWVQPNHINTTTFCKESVLFTELNCTRLGRTLFTYSRTFGISETLESRLILERQLSDVPTGIWTVVSLVWIPGLRTICYVHTLVDIHILV